jgi:hypothetical protein
VRNKLSTRSAGCLAAYLLTAMFAVLAVGCGSKTADKAAPESKLGSQQAPIAQRGSDESPNDDPCSLLEPKEVEAVLGAPLAVPPYRTGGNAPNGPSAHGDNCAYETADFHQILLKVHFTDGAQAYNVGGYANKLIAGHPDAATKKAFRLDDGTELPGEWDEARLTAMNCCLFWTMRGDQAIQIDFTGSDATLPQAAQLVNAAYRRIDKRLTIDGAAGVEAAKAHYKQRPQKVQTCKLLSRAEVEAIIGKLTADPTGKDEDCDYSVADPAYPGVTLVHEVSIIWLDGYRNFRQAPHIAGIAMGALMANTPFEKKAAAAQEREPAEESGPWLHAGDGSNGFMAVKKDVLVTVQTVGGKTTPEMRKLAAATMSKL